MAEVGAPPLVRNVQALRAIAAIMVVLIHATLPAVGVEDVLANGEHAWLGAFNYIGLFGVDLFFAISGFIMLVTSWKNFGKPHAGVRFIARRAIRIYPAYWLALVPVVPVLLFASDRFMVAHVGVKTGFAESILLLPNPNRFVLTVAWTLVWEMLFYVVFAGLISLDRRYVGFALAGWFVAELGAFFALRSSSNFYLHFIAAPIPIEFILGSVVGIAYSTGRLRAPLTATAIAAAVTAAAWTWSLANRIALSDPNDVRRAFVFGIPAALIVYAAVSLETSRRFVAPHAIASVGDASYAMYLWHLSILVVLRTIVARLHPAGPIAHAAVLALTIGVIVVFGKLVYRFFERPVTTSLNRLLDVRVRTVTLVASVESAGAK